MYLPAKMLKKPGSNAWRPLAALTDDSWFAASATDRERFRRFRHGLAEAVNEIIRQRGLMKANSDFAVPLARSRDILHLYRETLEKEFPGQYVIFGHIGDAHVHINVLPPNKEEWLRAMDLMKTFAARRSLHGRHRIRGAWPWQTEARLPCAAIYPCSDRCDEID